MLVTHPIFPLGINAVQLISLFSMEHHIQLVTNKLSVCYDREGPERLEKGHVCKTQQGRYLGQADYLLT